MAQPSYCVLIPTYNNVGTLKKIIFDVQSVCKDVIVVNDGSTDETLQVLNSITNIELVSYEKNQGKGFALRKGFMRAFEMGFDYAITIDSDGQHEAKNIPDLAAHLMPIETPVLLMGSRNMNQAGIPKKSSFGNRFSSFWYWAETGISLSDTQTGFRAYPLAPIAKKRWFTNRFEFEIEIIVRLAWTGVNVQEVPVLVNYPSDRISHFRPFADFARISVLNAILFTQAALWQTPKRLILGKGKKSLTNRLKRELKKNTNHPVKMAASIGTGIFFGIFPIWGFQMLVAFLISRIFKLNSVVVIGTSNISIPPFIPFIIFISFIFGAPFVPNGAIIPDLSAVTMQTIGLQLYQYIIGAVLFAFAAGIVGFLIAWVILQQAKKKKASN